MGYRPLQGMEERDNPLFIPNELFSTNGFEFLSITFSDRTRLLWDDSLEVELSRSNGSSSLFAYKTNSHSLVADCFSISKRDVY